MQRAANRYYKKFLSLGIGMRVFAVGLLLIASGGVYQYGQYSQSLQCLAQLVYVEARGMEAQAQYDVAHSVMNRVEANRPYFGGDTVCGVVHYVQDGVRQYSGVTREFTIPKDKEAWRRSMTVARDVLMRKVEPTEKLRGALYYLNPRHSDPGSVAWFRANLKEVGTSGTHVFYTDKK